MLILAICCIWLTLDVNLLQFYLVILVLVCLICDKISYINYYMYLYFEQRKNQELAEVPSKDLATIYDFIFLMVWSNIKQLWFLIIFNFHCPSSFTGGKKEINQVLRRKTTASVAMADCSVK